MGCSSRQLGCALGGVLYALACAGPPRPPPPKTYALGSARATYRDWREAKSSVCDAEPRWLIDELVAVNGLLRRFLDESDWTGAADFPQTRKSQLDEAQRTLPELLAAHRWSLEQLPRCGFASRGAFPSVRERGLEYVTAASARLEKIPAILEYLGAKSALERWQQDRPGRAAAAKEGCPRTRRKSEAGSLYYAWQDAQGATRWLFCDGTVVHASPSGSYEVTPPELSSRERKRFRQSRYVEAARKLPTSAIDRAPRVPAQPAP